MKALITGASSGIGKEFAKELAKRGYDIIITARRTDRLEELKKTIKNVNVEIFTCDLSKEEECYRLYETYPDVDILINNAGFGVFGNFENTDLSREIEMLKVNITAVHILMKLYYLRMKTRNNGYILNVASSAAFFPGPMFSSYYASKSYVYRLSEAVAEEIAKSKSNVHLSVLCPGPVDTEFNSVANVRFGVSSITAEYAAKYALNKMFKNKTVIVPSLLIKCTRLLSKLSPDNISAKIVYKIQKAKKE
ncbi:MAG: SDR family oxidoreductase [Clostridia bacterium]|nr:SDR family oxidoreductase [Clostridia bacterium]